jgi:small multidrug resistance pump
MQWAILFVAIVAEVIATSALKQAKGFTRLWPSVIVVSCYSLSLYLLAQTLEAIPVSIVYGIWSGSGVALITLVGRYYFKQVLDRPAVIGIALIVSGVLVLQFFSNTQLRPADGPAHSLPRNTMAPSAT